MLAARVLGNDQQEEELCAHAVDRLEVDAGTATGKRRDQALQAWELAVGNRDALADPRALQALPFQQHIEQALLVQTGLRGGQAVRHLSQDIPLGVGRKVQDHCIPHQNVHDLHVAPRVDRRTG